MARTALTTQKVIDAGLEAAFTAANVDGHSIDGDGDVVLEVMNGGGAPINVTIQTGGTLAGKAVADTVVAVTNGERRHIGRFRADLYNQPSGSDAGRVLVDFSDVTTVTVAAIGV